MSEEFVVRVNTVPSAQEIADAVGHADLRRFGDDLAEGVKFYIDKLSTRGIRVTSANCTDGDGTSVSLVLQTLSAPEDCRLLIDILAFLAEKSENKIDAEMLGEISIEQLREFCNEDWQQQSVASGTRILAHLIDEGRGPMTVPGVIRSFYLGKRLLKEFREKGSPLEEQCLAFMRHVQYFAEPESDASIFLSKKEGEADRKLCIWFGDGKILPPVDFVILANKDQQGEIIQVPFDDLTALDPSRFVLLDERQLVAKECSESEWQALRRLAVTRSINGGDER